MSRHENTTPSPELTGPISIAGANEEENMGPSTTTHTLQNNDGCTTVAYRKPNDVSGVNVASSEAASNNAEVEDIVIEADQASPIVAEQQTDGAIGYQTVEQFRKGRKTSRHQSDDWNKTAKNGTEPCLPRCNSCGFESNHDDEEPLWEQHARYDHSCPTIQGDIETNYFDIQSRKTQVLGNNVTLLRLKEWLLCKVCGVSISAIVIGLCRHLCLCQRCSEITTKCPTCGDDIVYRKCAQVQFSPPAEISG